MKFITANIILKRFMLINCFLTFIPAVNTVEIFSVLAGDAGSC
jgi:hypothetical protein